MKIHSGLVVLLLPLVMLLAKPAFSYEVERLLNGFDHPWGMDFIDQHRVLVTERTGQLWLVDIKEKAKVNIQGLPKNIGVQGQGGLLDVAIHPDFKQNQFVYLSYSHRNSQGLATQVSRGKLSFKNKSLSNLEVLFTAPPYSSGGRHFGSRLAFDKDNFLFITTGDRGDRPRAQDLNDSAGKIHRIHDNGGIPQDNPFKRKGKPSSIYTLGNRNVQGLFINSKNQVWAQEHGPRGGDELNKIIKGKNYGWPIISYGKEYWGPMAVGEGTYKKGMEQPQYYYDPSIAPSGLMQYEGDVFPQWRGAFFLGALKQRHLNILTPTKNGFKEERILEELGQRIRDVAQGPDGLIYLLTDSPKPNGLLLKLKPH